MFDHIYVTVLHICAKKQSTTANFMLLPYIWQKQIWTDFLPLSTGVMILKR